MQQGDRIVLVVPVGPVRVDASDRAELCTQALAGERAVVLNTGTKDWMHIQLESDGYTGWVDGKQWEVPTDDSGSAFILQAPFSGWLRSDGALMHYPAGSRLRRSDAGHWSLNGNGLEPVEPVGRALEAAEDAVISAIKAGLETYATEQLMDNGRRSWPTNPWDALETKPAGYTTDATDADVDGEWTYNTTSKKITHQRNDNSRVGWLYDEGTQSGDNAAVGTLGARASL